MSTELPLHSQFQASGAGRSQEHLKSKHQYRPPHTELSCCDFIESEQRVSPVASSGSLSKSTETHTHRCVKYTGVT